ncbi:MAG: phosphoribosylglycinamide formyltransferase [Polyangiales bacterium]
MAESQALRVLVLASGTGSNLRALSGALDASTGEAQICGVVSDRSDAKALVFAEERGWPTTVVRPKAFTDRTAWDTALAEACAVLNPDLVVLAGFMRIVGAPLLERFPNRILNVHPSLLPSFTGSDAPRQALASGVRITGCTVHVVDAGLDSGPIVAQAAVPVAEGDTEETLHQRIQAAEHRLLPAVVLAVASGELSLESPPRWRSARRSSDMMFAVPPLAPESPAR